MKHAAKCRVWWCVDPECTTEASEKRNLYIGKHRTLGQITQDYISEVRKLDGRVHLGVEGRTHRTPA